MNKALMRSTQVTVTFSVQLNTDHETELLTLVLALFTPILFLWRVLQTVNRIKHHLVLLTLDTKDLLIFIGKVIIITLKAFAYSLGMNV